MCGTNFLFNANNILVGVRASGGCSTTKSGMREMCKPSAPVLMSIDNYNLKSR